MVGFYITAEFVYLVYPSEGVANTKWTRVPSCVAVTKKGDILTGSRAKRYAGYNHVKPLPSVNKLIESSDYFSKFTPFNYSALDFLEKFWIDLIEEYSLDLRQCMVVWNDMDFMKLNRIKRVLSSVGFEEIYVKSILAVVAAGYFLNYSDTNKDCNFVICIEQGRSLILGRVNCGCGVVEVECLREYSPKKENGIIGRLRIISIISELFYDGEEKYKKLYFCNGGGRSDEEVSIVDVSFTRKIDLNRYIIEGMSKYEHVLSLKDGSGILLLDLMPIEIILRSGDSKFTINERDKTIPFIDNVDWDPGKKDWDDNQEYYEIVFGYIPKYKNDNTEIIHRSELYRKGASKIKTVLGSNFDISISNIKEDGTETVLYEFCAHNFLNSSSERNELSNKQRKGLIIEIIESYSGLCGTKGEDTNDYIEFDEIIRRFRILYGRTNIAGFFDSEEFINEVFEIMDLVEKETVKIWEIRRAYRQKREVDAIVNIFKWTKKLIRSYGIEPIVAEGYEFCELFHNAVSRETLIECREKKYIYSEIKRGYRRGGEILRKSEVEVIN